MNTTTTTTNDHTETAKAMLRLAAAHEALAPYWGEDDAIYQGAPAALMMEYAEAILGVPASSGEILECLAPGAWGQQVAWAQQQLERRDYPEFFAGLEEIGRIREEHGEDALHGQEYSGLFVKLLRTAPPRYRAEADNILSEALPTATHVTEDGQAVFSAQQIADKWGVPVDEVEAQIQRMADMGLSDGIHTGPVHPIQ